VTAQPALTINLLRPRRAARPALRPRTLALWALPIAVAAALGAWTAVLHDHLAGDERELAALSRQLASLRPLADQAASLERALATVRARDAVLARLLGTGLPASAPLEAVRSAIPGDAWLDAVGAAGEKDARIDGHALSYRTVAQFMVNLAATGQFASVDLGEAREDRIGDRAVVRFSITAALPARHPASQASAAWRALP
jgi:Tfp pilus assembly protein PilN